MKVKLLSHKRSNHNDNNNNNNNKNSLSSSSRMSSSSAAMIFTTLCLLNASSSSLAIASIDEFDFIPIKNNNDNSRNYNKYARIDVNDDPAVNVLGENTRPIIGILTQEVSRFIERTYPKEKYNSYLAASYVKYVEGAGGRAVPIWIGKERTYYEDIMSKINGVLLPGGSSYFNKTGGYAEAGQHIYDIAIELNKRGIYMPVWGTCLGFELLIHLSLNNTDMRDLCKSSSQALPLEFEKGYRDSRLFGAAANNDVLYYLGNLNVTVNFHIYCYTKETFATHGLNNIWKVLSVNHDWNGKEFISTIEHKVYPFYGVQYHPEKIIYEFVPNRNITHTSQAVLVSQYFANFFVNESRKNMQKFPDANEETKSLIYNYQPEYTGAKGSAFLQLYMFDAKQANTASTAGETQLHYLTVTLITVVAAVANVRLWQGDV